MQKVIFFVIEICSKRVKSTFEVTKLHRVSDIIVQYRKINGNFKHNGGSIFHTVSAA